MRLGHLSDVVKYLAGLLKPLVGQGKYHVKNPTQFAGFIQSFLVALDDILVSLDVVSFFTRIPVEGTLSLLDPLFPPSVIELFSFVLRSTVPG